MPRSETFAELLDSLGLEGTWAAVADRIGISPRRLQDLRIGRVTWLRRDTEIKLAVRMGVPLDRLRRAIRKSSRDAAG